MTSRRKFLQVAGGAAVVTGLASPALASQAQDKAAGPLRVCVFSKHLQFLDWAAMAGTAAEIGFDGVDVTVRKGGHVAPERADQDLPKVAEIIRKAGLDLPMVTAGIVDANTPHAESMLRAMKSAGITRYRWGGFRYDDRKPIPERLAELKPEAAKLADLNRRYDVCAMYHTHSGAEVGASIWDLWVMLKDLDASRVGVNLDIGHATIEGGVGGWVNSTRLITPLMRGVAIKDFKWAQNTRGEWQPQWCPLGQGMVNFKRFFALLKEAKFSGPVQLHFEYPLGGADKGATTLTTDKSGVIAAMKKDLSTLRGWLRDAQLA
ncbi:MAG TPA: sugar phosphate isomerase/epimerase family protein [Blastocatellia bacterium]|nr:sugar phosphate isomerase/epimerase family protein [Blastocatellia bacterium]